MTYYWKVLVVNPPGLFRPTVGRLSRFYASRGYGEVIEVDICPTNLLSSAIG